MNNPMAMYTLIGMLLVGGTASMPRTSGAPTATAATQPVSRSAEEDGVTVRQVEVTLLGRISDLQGIQWPSDARMEHALSAVVTEPCDLTIRLPSGRTLNIRVRPLLIISRAFEQNTVVALQFPGGIAKSASLAEQAREMERLLAEWEATPTEHMGALIAEFKNSRPPDPGALVMPVIERVGYATLDDHSTLMFELWGPKDGKWSFVIAIEASPKDRVRIKCESEAKTTGDFEQQHRPRTQP